VHDRLEEHGWDVLIADATKVKGLAPVACKTDKIDARVLATLSARDLVAEIWLPDPSIRRERELARFRLHLVRHLQIAALTVQLKRQGAEHRYIPMLAPLPAWGGSTRSPSPRRLATSPASRRRPSCAATPGCAHASSSPGPPTPAALNHEPPTPLTTRPPS
jgi:hypothetical protein